MGWCSSFVVQGRIIAEICVSRDYGLCRDVNISWKFMSLRFRIMVTLIIIEIAPVVIMSFVIVCGYRNRAIELRLWSLDCGMGGMILGCIFVVFWLF